MRVFISSLDLTGAKRTTRVTIHHCTSTTALIRQICKQLRLNRRNVIIKLKQESHNLIVVQGWNIELYPIKNGSTFIIQELDIGIENSTLQQPLTRIEEEDVFDEEVRSQYSDEQVGHSDSLRMEARYSTYFEDNLNRMLQSVRNGNLTQIAGIMKQQPENVDDEEEIAEVIIKKNNYLMNQVGDCGRNSLHWAIHINNPDLVSFLLIKGANPNIVTIDQYTPLQLAVQHHAHGIVDLLLSHHQIDPNQITAHGTALHLAVKNQDVKCIELLLQNDASLELQDNDGKTPVQVCKSQKIGAILSRKAQMGKLQIPSIAKGAVFRVSSTTKRLKERNMLLNPFKNDLTISQINGDVQEKLQISSIKVVEEIKERGWLMKSSVYYFKITLQAQEKGIMFATHHSKICHRWVHHLKTALLYLQYAQYIKPVPAVDQVVEFLDDQKGQTVKHKRKVYEKPVTKTNNGSVLDLKESSPHYSKKTYLKNTEGTSNRSNEQDRLNESQIVLGSVIETHRFSSQTRSDFTTNSFEGSISPFSLEPEHSDTKDKEKQQSGFKKKHDNRVEEVSQFSLPKTAPTISYIDFEVMKLLGNGAFGKVYMARHKKTALIYALKVLSKKKLFAKKQLKYAVGETNILKRVNNPFTVKLYYAFQTPNNLYMAMDHCPLGDLAELIATKQQLKQRTARFVIAQLILAIQYLHKLGILYRDLKPENILIDRDGYIKLTDFGLSRENSFATSFCGSPAYLSPEMLEKKGVGTSSDIYGIGCVLYEMVVGEPPFFNEDMDTLFQNIKGGKLRFPSHTTIELKSLISRLLERNIQKRLGVKDIGEIKKHDFFKKFDWQKLEEKKLDVPSEMFANKEPDQIGGIELQVKENIKLVDYDYSQDTTNMINRIKNFTFVRGEHEQYEIVPASVLSLKSK